MKKILIIPAAFVIGTLVVSCLSKEKAENKERNPSAYGDTNTCAPLQYSVGSNVNSYTFPAFNTMTNSCEVAVPQGLFNNDLADFEHLSEGADVYPYEWFMHLKSKVFEDSKIFNVEYKGQYKGYYHELLDKKFGLLKSHAQDTYREVNGTKRKVKYVMPYSGLTAAWSNHRFDNSDADKTDDVSNYPDAFYRYQKASGQMITEDRIVKEINGIKSIRMVGTNCALCHSGAIEYGGKQFHIEGSPSMVNVRGFFKDMAVSTVFMLSDKGVLKNFLEDIKKSNPSKFVHIDPKKDANEINYNFLVECSSDTNSVKDKELLGPTAKFLIKYSPFGVLRHEGCLVTLLFAKKGNNERLFKAVKAIRNGLTALLKKTYNLSDADLDKTHLRHRMDYFAKLSVGIDPTTIETPSGFNRTDAFGRIGNLVLRGSHPVDITSPVSLPWMWGLKYMANLHYNGNSNSVIMRNVGQSLGLGSIILDPKTLESTTNVYNLDKMEHLVHKIRIPEWKEIFKEQSKTYKELEINEALLPRGYEIYKTNCMGCHESNKFVGPSMVLREYKMFPLSNSDGKYSPNTDRYAATNAIKPITDETDPVLAKLVPFEQSIFIGVGAIKAKYYKDYNISEAQQKEMEFYNIRGNEFFRDTYNGFDKQAEYKNNYGNIEKGLGYKARHLSGVWATAPYLHNGSVPNIWELLKPAKQRPKYFNVYSMKFDPKYFGAPVSEWNRNNKKCDLDDKVDKEICFNAYSEEVYGKSNDEKGMAGNSNAGHEWGTGLSDADKLALIEFLKYLPPEPEYSWNKDEKY